MNKEEQKKLLTEIMEADEKDGLYKTNTMAQQTYGEWMRSNPPITLTAVDWYYEQTVIQGKTNYAELLEQAKQMEKEQIIQFGKKIADHWGMTEVPLEYIEQYYNETYGK